MKQKVEFPYQFNITDTDEIEKNEIMQFALSLGLKIRNDDDPFLYGHHTFGLIKFIYPEEKFLSSNTIIGRMGFYKAVGLPVWSFLWENRKDVPKYWEKYCLIFGDIFENIENDKKYVLVFSFLNTAWVFSFEEITEHSLPPQNVRFVCFVA